MKAARSYRQTSERHYSAHHMLLDAAEEALLVAGEKNPGWFNHALAAMTFSALAIEAMANAYGSQVVPHWRDYESSSPQAKMRLIAKQLGVTLEEEKDPWAAIKWLGQFRNQIAHAKPESISESKLITEQEKSERRIEMPISKLERWVTVQHASRAVRSVQGMKKLLYEHLKSEDHKALLYSDGYSGTTEPHEASYLPNADLVSYESEAEQVWRDDIGETEGNQGASDGKPVG
jgi:hypothetical protein